MQNRYGERSIKSSHFSSGRYTTLPIRQFQNDSSEKRRATRHDADKRPKSVTAKIYCWNSARYFLVLFFFLEPRGITRAVDAGYAKYQISGNAPRFAVTTMQSDPVEFASPRRLKLASTRIERTETRRNILSSIGEWKWDEKFRCQ